MPEMTLAEKKTYLTTGPAGSVSYDWPDPDKPNGVDTRTLAAWVANGNVSVIQLAVRDVSVGRSLGLLIAAGEIDSRLVQKAVFRGAEYPNRLPTVTQEQVKFGLIYPTFDMSDEIMVKTMEEILKPSHDSLPDNEKELSCLSYFQQLKTKTATIAEHLGGLTMDKLNAICAPE